MKKLISAALLTVATALPSMGSEQKQAASPAPQWMENAVIYEANLRQGTKDRNLRGLQLELPRLRDLGVDVIWLMPVHPISEKNRKGTLGSYYAVRDYKNVNPEFGSLDDIKEFVRTAHTLGMKVILDEVCNHTGCDNAWVSEHPEYYAKDKDGNMFGPFDWTDTYKLDYSNPGTRQAMKDALKFWVTDVDIDGYRCDVAMEVPTDFWEEAREELQTIKPVFMLAEASKPELLKKAFDADYAWPMKDVFNAIAANKGVNEYAKAKDLKYKKTTGSDIKKLLDSQSVEYPLGSVHMNMITNHDLNSWEGTEFERLGPATGAFAVLSYTLPGIPMLYTGQETGFNHALEFFENDEIQPDYTANEFTAFYKMLNSLKHNNRALDAGKNGGSIEFLPTGSDDVVAFSRNKGENSVIVIANLSTDENKTNKIKGMETTGMTDWFSGEEAILPETLAPWQYLVFVK